MVVNYNVSPSCHTRTKSVSSPREAFVLWQPPSVRDWSGILCELFWGNGDGNGNGNGIWERGERAKI